MALLRRLWVAMRTENTEDSGTADPIVLIVNEGGVDKLHHTLPRVFPDDPRTFPDDQGRGKGSLFEIDVRGKDIHSENISNSSIRLGIRGSDFWHPEHVLIWGEASGSGAVIPLVLEANIKNGISTDASEGNTSFGLRRIGLSRASESVVQLIACLTTADVEDAGTSDKVDLRLTFANGRRERSLELPDLKRGRASFADNQLFFTGEPQPTRNNLDSVSLNIFSEDAWQPRSLFLFASPQSFGGIPQSVIPLVYIPRWTLGKLSGDPDEGSRPLALPLAPIPS